MRYLKERLDILMRGRRGMDEFSKFLFLVWAASVVISFIAVRWLLFPGRLIGSLCRIVGLLAIVLCFVRALSRNISARETENIMYLQWFSKQRTAFEAYKNRRALSKEYRFFKCPNCGKYVRVPKGKGKIHINCKCGYVLFRKT